MQPCSEQLHRAMLNKVVFVCAQLGPEAGPPETRWKPQELRLHLPEFSVGLSWSFFLSDGVGNGFAGAMIMTLEAHDDPRGLITLRVFFISEFRIIHQFCTTIVQHIVHTLSIRPRPRPQVPGKRCQVPSTWYQEPFTLSQNLNIALSR